jgi:hypothetical protein
MKAIHKYVLKATPGVQQLQTRQHAKFLRAGTQGETISLWYEVDTHNSWVYSHFLEHLTGQELDKELHKRAQYVDTLILENGAYVVHLYRIE